MKSFLFVIILGSSNCLQAAEVLNNYDLYWTKAQPIVNRQSWGQVKSTIQQRVLPGPGTMVIPVATMTNTVVETHSKQSSEQIQQMKGFIERIYAVKSWKQIQKKQYTNFEGFSTISGQMVKLFVSVEKNSMKTSLATLELGAITQTYLETEIKQREFFTEKKSSFSYWSLLENKAYAQEFSLTDINSIRTLWLQPNPTSTSINGLSAAVIQNGNQTAQLSSSVREVSNGLNTAAGNLAAPINNLSAVFKDTDSFSKAGGAFGFAFGVTEKVGGLVAQTIWDLGPTAIRNLFYEIRGSLKPEVRDDIIKRTDAALKDLEPLAQQINLMNVKLNTSLLALEQLDGRNPTDAAIANKRRIEEIEKNIQSKQDIYLASTNFENKAECSIQINALQKVLAQSRQVQETIEGSIQGHDQCAEFNSISRIMNSLRLRMSQYRQQLFNTMPLIIQSLDETPAADVVTDRKLDNCSSSKITRFQGRIKTEKCDCSQKTEAKEICLDLCDSYDLAKDSFGSCQRSVKIATSVSKEAKEVQYQKILNDDMHSLVSLQEELAQGFCRGSSCSSNSFTSFSDNVKKKIENIQKVCDKKKAGSLVPLAVQNTGAEKAEFADKSNLPISEVSAKNLPSNSGEAPSFFAGIFGKVKKFFGIST